jgi:hypothetical protein
MKKKNSKKGRKSITEKTCTYCIEILDWELPYSFSVNRHKDTISGPFWEHLSLKLTGKIFYPEKLTDKGIEINIIGDRRFIPLLEDPYSKDYEPESIGWITIRGKQSECSAWVPFDILHPLGSLLKGERIKFLIVSGQPLYRGHADIASIDFERDFNPADWL